MATDLPPAYDLIKTPPATIDFQVSEESDLNQDDGTVLVANAFEDKTMRIGFIQKVLTIKVLQLLLMTMVLGICASFAYHVRYSNTIVHLIVLSTIALLATSGLLFYCEKAWRSSPFRYLFLIIHPVTIGTFISLVTIAISPNLMDSLLVAWVTYLGAVFAVMVYSVFCLQTELEFAAKYAYILAACVQILLYAGVVPSLYVDALFALYTALVLALVYVYTFWDLEFMTSTKYWHDITPDKFMDGALNLEIDYYYLFKNIILPKIRKFRQKVNSDQ